MTGPATSASWRTPSSGRWRWSRRRSCCPRASRPTCGPGRPNGVGGLGRALSASGPAGLPELEEGFDLEARGEEFYRHYIALALERAGGVQTKAAEMLGMSFRSFRYYAKKFNLR